MCVILILHWLHVCVGGRPGNKTVCVIPNDALCGGRFGSETVGVRVYNPAVMQCVCAPVICQGCALSARASCAVMQYVGV